MTDEPDFGRNNHFDGDVSIWDWQAARAIAREHMITDERLTELITYARRWAHDAARIRRVLALPGYAGPHSRDEVLQRRGRTLDRESTQ